jgi:predicted RNA-binding Zn-ribbon protein involved in translation (DUF1610 family)
MTLLADLIPTGDEWIPFVICIAIFGFLGLMFLLIIISSAREKGIGRINLLQVLGIKPVHCPKCGERAPIIRQPKNTRQALGGGCTCEKCGTEYDKWGKAISPGR